MDAEPAPAWSARADTAELTPRNCLPAIASVGARRRIKGVKRGGPQSPPTTTFLLPGGTEYKIMIYYSGGGHDLELGTVI